MSPFFKYAFIFSAISILLTVASAPELAKQFTYWLQDINFYFRDFIPTNSIDSIKFIDKKHHMHSKTVIHRRNHIFLSNINCLIAKTIWGQWVSAISHIMMHLTNIQSKFFQRLKTRETNNGTINVKINHLLCLGKDRTCCVYSAVVAYQSK